jgi:hypothetical protein
MRIQGKKNFLKNWLIISSMESILALKIKQLTKNHSINCCKYCGKKFKLKKSLSNHLLRSHLIIKSEFNCNINGCNYKTLIKSLFEKHIKKHKTKVIDSVDSKTQFIGSDNNGIILSLDLKIGQIF